MCADCVGDDTMANGKPNDSGRPKDERSPEEFPDDEELPEEPSDVHDIDPFENDPAAFEDINRFAESEWKESTTARDRVRAVIKRTEVPQSANDIAETAQVSETTARNTLNNLAEEGVVHAEKTANGRIYQRDPDWYLMQRVQRLSESDQLISRIQHLQEELNQYREQYGTDSPEELVVSDGVLSEEELAAVSEWRTAKRDLSFLRAAYRFREARQVTSRDRYTASGTDDTTGVPH